MFAYLKSYFSAIWGTVLGTQQALGKWELNSLFSFLNLITHMEGLWHDTQNTPCISNLLCSL